MCLINNSYYYDIFIFNFGGLFQLKISNIYLIYNNKYFIVSYSDLCSEVEINNTNIESKNFIIRFFDRTSKNIFENMEKFIFILNLETKLQILINAINYIKNLKDKLADYLFYNFLEKLAKVLKLYYKGFSLNQL
jgi:hypothetical protein